MNYLELLRRFGLIPLREGVVDVEVSDLSEIFKQAAYVARDDLKRLNKSSLEASREDKHKGLRRLKLCKTIFLALEFLRKSSDGMEHFLIYEEFEVEEKVMEPFLSVVFDGANSSDYLGSHVSTQIIEEALYRGFDVSSVDMSAKF